MSTHRDIRGPQSRPAGGLEGGFDDLEVRSPGGSERHAGHVEADVVEPPAAVAGLSQPTAGEAPEAALLLPVDGLGGQPEVVPCPGLHLAEDDRPAPGHDEVQLALPAPPVAAQHGVAP